MTAEDFAEALRRLIGYAEDEGGLDRETLLVVIEDMAQAMRECEE
jgi:hypothetical protein